MPDHKCPPPPVINRNLNGGNVELPEDARIPNLEDELNGLDNALEGTYC